ncbi:hypothetical protein FSP39_003799 [Pinctada imbricata]|uniref:TIR domain-containing protein n=1 Tax=Pinctada imbricata TaxID=66713 RepID=A0AA88Y4Q5_PINIB|nr:hypothetical protein FSP39_003799 [Pinctada imbricata]
MDISGNKASKIIGPIIGLTRLKFVNMSQIQCFELGSFVFSHLEQLEFLDMNGNDLGGMLQNEHDGSLFSFLHNLKVLNLSTNGINHLPEKIFTGLTSLETLVLRRNSLKEIKTDLFFMQNLSFIDLSENSLSELSVSFMNDIEFLSRSKKVSLSLHPNPLRCACDTMKMLYWLKRMKSFIKDFNYLTCSLYEGNANVKGLSDLEVIIITLEKECNSYLWLIFGTLSLIIFVSAIHRWKIRYFFYISRNKYKMFKRYTGDAHLSRFRYDAFVSYSDENKEFVLDEMIRELEEVSQLRLCLSGRDFRPGVSIAENITRSINKSKKTIVIMSVDYLLSYWCMYELNMARMESLYSRSDQDVLMMIVLEKVAFQNAPHVVLELINNNSFLEYPDDQHGKILFWEKIRETFA